MFPLFFFFFNDTATTEIYTLSLHDALPISPREFVSPPQRVPGIAAGKESGFLQKLGASATGYFPARAPAPNRSEEHTSELQSRPHLVCRLLLEKKKTVIRLIAPLMSSVCNP